MNHHKWSGLKSVPKIANNLVNGCLDFNNKEYSIGDLITENISKTKSFTYMCSSFKQTKRWEVKTHVTS
jgi:hypothetical protein